MHLKLEHQTVDTDAIFNGINSEAALKGLKLLPKPFAILLKNPQGKVFGGISGASYYGALHIDMLWTDTSIRGQGYGKKLVSAAEELAKEQSCHFLTLTTMSFEAERFYEKLGYLVEFKRSGYEQNSELIFLKKIIDNTKK